MTLEMKPCQLLVSGVLGLRCRRGGLTHGCEYLPGSRTGPRGEVPRLREDLESRACTVSVPNVGETLGKAEIHPGGRDNSSFGRI